MPAGQWRGACTKLPLTANQFYHVNIMSYSDTYLLLDMVDWESEGTFKGQIQMKCLYCIYTEYKCNFLSQGFLSPPSYDQCLPPTTERKRHHMADREKKREREVKQFLKTKPKWTFKMTRWRIT